MSAVPQLSLHYTPSPSLVSSRPAHVKCITPLSTQIRLKARDSEVEKHSHAPGSLFAAQIERMDLFFVLRVRMSQDLNETAGLDVIAHMVVAEPGQPCAPEGQASYCFAVIGEQGASDDTIRDAPFLL